MSRSTSPLPLSSASLPTDSLVTTDVHAVRALAARVHTEGPLGLVVFDADDETASRLAGHARSSSRAALVLRGRCVAGRAFAPIASIVQEALAASACIDGPGGITPEIERALGCEPGCHARWWDHERTDRAEPASGDAPLARRAFLATERSILFEDGIRAVIARAARREAVILVLDGVEHLDHGTADFLRRWAEDALHGTARMPLLVLGVTASARAASQRASALARWMDAPRVNVCDAGRVDRDALADWLGDPRVLEWLLARSGGGRKRELERWLTAAGPLEPAPTSPLSQAPLRVAQALAVARLIGRRAPVRWLVGPDDQSSLERELERCGVLVRDADGAAIPFPLPAPVLDDASLRSARASAARALERMGALEEAAFHASQSDDPTLHVRLALDVEPLLSARHAHREAAELLESARTRLAPDDARIGIVDARLARLWNALGDSERAIAAARSACERAPDDTSARLAYGGVLLRAGQSAEAVRVLAAIEESTTASPKERLDARCLAAQARDTAGDLAGARRDALALLDETGGLGPAAIEARNVLGKVALATGERGFARTCFETNLEAARDAGRLDHECIARQNLAITMLLDGALDDAATQFEVSAALARVAGAAWHRGIALENLGVLFHLRGRWRAAHQHYLESEQILERIGHRDWRVRLLLNRAELEHCLGDVAEARELLARALRIGGRDLRPAVARRARILDASLHLALGHVERARDVFSELLDDRSFVDVSLRQSATLGLARCHLARGQAAPAEEVMRSVGGGATPRLDCELREIEVQLAVANGGPVISLARTALELATRAEHREVALALRCHLARAQWAEGAADAARLETERASALEAAMREEVPEHKRELFDARPAARALRELRARLERASEPPVRGGREAGRAGLAIVGESRAVQRLRASIERVAGSDALVLVLGESGTGKELVADALHRASRRAQGPLVRVNCAALSESLLLSELFGHERGAFTGASTRKAGLFETATGGTLFLDEIGDISPATQVALLRVLQEKTLVRVGGTTPVHVDVRVIAATHRRLEQLVKSGRMRQDLYFRLRGIVLEVPALRERLEDLPRIAEALLARIARDEQSEPKHLSHEALVRLRAHAWPGNVRELENVLRAAFVLAEGTALSAEDVEAHLGVRVDAPDENADGAGEPGIESLYWAMLSEGRSVYELRQALERQAIERAIEEAGGNLSKAAQRLGMKRPRLSQLAKEYGLRGRSS